jgi:hypothetical protein
MLVMSAVTAGISIQNQNAAANAEAQAAESAAVADYQQLHEQSLQIGMKGTLENVARSRQALRERSRLKVAMGEAGVQGNSPLREIANSLLQESFDKGINKTNYTNALAQTNAQSQAVYANELSRINSADSKRIGALQSILMIGSSAMSGYASGAAMSDSINGGTTGYVNSNQTSVSPNVLMEDVVKKYGITESYYE